MASRGMAGHHFNPRRPSVGVLLMSALTGLQEEIILLMAQVGDMDTDDIQARLCVASRRKFTEAMDGLKLQKIVMYRGAAADGAWRLLHNPLANNKGGKQ